MQPHSDAQPIQKKNLKAQAAFIVARKDGKKRTASPLVVGL
ncbi:MAG: hypothetical protein WC505_04875 [Patescibacteria group bacterium]